MDSDIPSCAWKMPLTGAPIKPGKPRGYPLRLILRMIPVYLRLRRKARRAKKEGKPSLGINITGAIDDGYNQGVPIGGFGSGSIGRSYLGDFARWHLRIGKHEYTPSLPNQFHLRIKQKNDLMVKTLNPRIPRGERLSRWNWGLNPNRAIYYALFPRAWTEYDFSDYGIRATCQQLSPIIAHNYRESSFPVGIFSWNIRNVTNDDIDIAVMLTWENAISPTSTFTKEDIHRVGKSRNGHLALELANEHTRDGYPVSFGLAVQGDRNSELSCADSFNTEGNGSEVWDDFQREGELSSKPKTSIDTPRRTGAALCSKTEIPPGETAELVFSISWDIPIMEFGLGRRWYRRYTRFFDTSGNNAIPIAELALKKWRDWEQMIIDWQKPIIESDKPDWLKSALFNELYYLVDGGTSWENGEVEKGPRKDGIGHFGYLECYDYPFVNTLDVHFYASFALAINWPEIEKSIQYDFAAIVPMDDTRLVDLLFEKKQVHRKPRGAIPHDLGMPLEDPWFAPNAYRVQDVGRWKDLNSKFVLLVYRIFTLTNDEAFLRKCWSSVLEAMEYLEAFDRDGDGLPENEGFPDQTYDVWTMKEVSAYCSGLFLAASEAIAVMAERLGENAVADKYQQLAKRGKKIFDEKLWNGEYYNFDSSKGKHSDSIMADQLAGQWFAHVCGLSPIVSHDKARKALQTIFKYNVMGFVDGMMGAVNGMRPDGRIDGSSIQSAEVWVGTSYAVAALMIQEGLLDEGLKTAEGVYQVIYKNRGYWFRTPEAWTKKGNFRASMYMRPLTIWAIQHALSSVKS